MPAKNATPATPTVDAPVNAPETPAETTSAPEKRVAPAREVPQALAHLAATQLSLDGATKRADIIRAVAEATLSNIDAVMALLALASESIAAQKPSDKTICAQEMLAQCYAVVSDYNDADNDAARMLALDTLRVKYAALSVWLSTSGKNVRDSVTGQERARSDSETRAMRMARAVGGQATRLVPFALTPEKRADVDKYISDRKNARLARGQRVVDAVQPAIAPASK